MVGLVPPGLFHKPAAQCTLAECIHLPTCLGLKWFESKTGCAGWPSPRPSLGPPQQRHGVRRGHHAAQRTIHAAGLHALPGAGRKQHSAIRLQGTQLGGHAGTEFFFLLEVVLFHLNLPHLSYKYEKLIFFCISLNAQRCLKQDTCEAPQKTQFLFNFDLFPNSTHLSHAPQGGPPRHSFPAPSPAPSAHPVPVSRRPTTPATPILTRSSSDPNSLATPTPGQPPSHSPARGTPAALAFAVDVPGLVVRWMHISN